MRGQELLLEGYLV
jgi:hypothetical protein